MTARITLLAFIVTCGLSSTANADMYTFVDDDGVMHVSNVPSDKRYTLWFRSEKNGSSERSTKVGTRAARYNSLIETAAKANGVERALLHAIISVESGYNERAVSHKGAVGLMQLMPETARRYGVTDLLDPAQNLKAGAAYLRDLLQRFNSDLHLVLAAYNAGEGAIAKYGNKVPPYPETIAYLPKVIALYQQFRAQM